MAGPPEIAETLVVRAWIEPAHTTALRARVTYTLGGTPSTTTTSSVDEVCALVRAWLEHLPNPQV